MPKKRIKWDIEKVKQYFEDRDCELYETEYVNNRIKMRYRCNCGNEECKICFGDFQQGRRCKKCGIKRRADKRRLIFKEVKQYLEDHNCELYETEYKGVNILMRYRCNCGNKKCKITFHNFKAGHRCRECSNERLRKERQLSFKDVKKYFEDHDCELLETKYKNSKTLMRYRCKCGNKKCKITFANFSSGKRCMECGGTKKHTFKEVKQYFKDHDCELKETEYVNGITKMKYICDCGNDECEITFNNFKRGHRCKKCAIKRNSGKNSSSYNPNLTDEERKNSRPGCKKWKKDVRKRDNSTCQICGETEGVLCAHHIEDYGNNKELRTVVSNGFLFCEKHHKLFHKIYGNNCNRKQLNEFLSSFAEKNNVKI